MRPEDGGHRETETRCTRAHCERETAIQNIWTGPAFAFPTRVPVLGGARRVTTDDVALLNQFFAELIPDVLAGNPFAATIIDGSAVAVCRSVRRTAMAHEAGVQTAEPFRGRGLALSAVSAWARDVQARGAIPLYSTSWDNAGSRAVARKLDLVQFGSDLHIT